MTELLSGSFDSFYNSRESLADLPKQLIETIGDTPGIDGASPALARLSQAIVRLLLFDLTKTRHWSPLGSHSCIAKFEPQYIESCTTQALQDELATQAHLLSLSVRCSPSGKLLVSASHVELPGIYSVANILSDVKLSSQLVIGSHIILSPSGRVVSYCGEAGQSKKTATLELQSSLHGSQRNMDTGANTMTQTQTENMNILAQQGLKVDPLEQWVKVCFTEPVATQDADDIREYRGFSDSFLWPASLCFCKFGRSSNSKTLTVSSEQTQASSKDPLTVAESWFLAKSSRDEVAEAIRRNNEIHTKRLAETQKRDPDIGLPESFILTHQYSTSHDAANMYPTPPDALLNTFGSSNNQLTQDSSDILVDASSLGNVQKENVLPSSPLVSSTDPGICSTLYDEPKHEDLFGELDSEMPSGVFAATDLTEADFSFFDEPSVDINIDGEALLLENSSKLKQMIHTPENLGLPQASAENSESSIAKTARLSSGSKLIANPLEAESNNGNDESENPFSV